MTIPSAASDPFRASFRGSRRPRPLDPATQAFQVPAWRHVRRCLWISDRSAGCVVVLRVGFWYVAFSSDGEVVGRRRRLQGAQALV